MNKSKVTVTILNLEYQIMAGSLEEEMYIRKTAKFIEDEAMGFMELGGMTAFNALVQATMNIADMLFKERATTENLRGQIVQFAERSTKLEKEVQRIKTEKVKKEKKENKLPKTPRDGKGLDEVLSASSQGQKTEVKGKREKSQEEIVDRTEGKGGELEAPTAEQPLQEQTEEQTLPVTGKDVRFQENRDSDPDGLMYNSNLLEGLDTIPIPSMEAGQEEEEQEAEAETPETPETPDVQAVEPPEKAEEPVVETDWNTRSTAEAKSQVETKSEETTKKIEKTTEKPLEKPLEKSLEKSLEEQLLHEAELLKGNLEKNRVKEEVKTVSQSQVVTRREVTSQDVEEKEPSQEEAEKEEKAEKVTAPQGKVDGKNPVEEDKEPTPSPVPEKQEAKQEELADKEASGDSDAETSPATPATNSAQQAVQEERAKDSQEQPALT